MDPVWRVKMMNGFCPRFEFLLGDPWTEKNRRERNLRQISVRTRIAGFSTLTVYTEPDSAQAAHCSLRRRRTQTVQ
ncbi:hypothetical protein SKAU_G00310720 [Synaphobranchus kaupii]|uniref:Uncharacterized protein n=1 Tax=Synaphobranchus kaupii TaxID=118154 RepID=A0A9Q1ERT2_SYNKA|nr:hypothetical protein SKAU_G00310720 [Synaphobranchus kaupii]